MEAIERTNGKMTILPPPPPPSGLLGWLIEQLTILAEAFGESLTPARLRIYAEVLADVEQQKLVVAFKRALCECKFFPKVAELREFAGAKAEDVAKVEAEAAWDFVNRYLREHGVVVYDNDDRPPLPPRIDYALRRIGGLRGLNQITAESRPFMFKDFVEAYRLAPIADLPELEATRATWQLAVRAPKRLTAAGRSMATHKTGKPIQGEKDCGQGPGGVSPRSKEL